MFLQENGAVLDWVKNTEKNSYWTSYSLKLLHTEEWSHKK